jgi:hypothetical protein
MLTTINALLAACTAGITAKDVPHVITCSKADRLLRLLEVTLRTPTLLHCEGGQLPLLYLLPHALPPLHALASSPGGSTALLSAITTAAKRQQALNTTLALLLREGGAPAPAAAAVKAAVPGAMGRALAKQLEKQLATTVQHASGLGAALAETAEFMLTRAAALLDPVLAPAAAFLARHLPPGDDSLVAGLEAVLRMIPCRESPQRLMLLSPQHMAGVTEVLRSALAHQQAAPATKQAAKLAKKAGAGAAEAQELRQQLQDMWLGGSTAGGSTSAGGAQQSNSADVLASLAASSLIDPNTYAASNSHGRPTAVCPPGEMPIFMRVLCDMGLLPRQQVLAAGDPAQWAAAVRPPTPADLHVAGTALLVACKAAGAVAELPQLLESVSGFMGPAMSQLQKDLTNLRHSCSTVADWALLLAPILGLLLSAEQAADLEEAAASVDRDMQRAEEHARRTGMLPMLPAATVTKVLGLLGAVVPPGALGCSYPGCCNLEGPREKDLSVQACSKCRGVRYCCREHQVAHWKAGHKEVCKAAQAAARQVMDAATGGSDQLSSS